MVKNLTTGKTKPLGSIEAANEHVSTGNWSHVDGVNIGGKGGVMKIYMSAAQPSKSRWLSRTGSMRLTGPQNLVETIHHEYLHHLGAQGHSVSPRSWGIRVRSDLGGFIRDL